MSAFYEPDGAGYRATELTRGPWDPGAQHAGPPAALLGRELELLPEAEDFQVCRLTFEILRSIPIGAVGRVRGWQPGAKVSMTIIRPPQQGHALQSSSASSPSAVSSSSAGVSGTPSSLRARAMFSARLPLANRP